ncbi:MAG: succinate dehydrogenase, cytochrome b556 subunit, partial [Chloroflexota bacterium]|nr:succinate dehydrogenase, cytochrome b556 subunit [Chloroflexota bacterium]
MINLFGYRVSWTQLAWFGHRASGLGVLLFLFLHIVETSTVLLGPEVYDFTQTFYANLPAKIGEVLLMAALVYHSLNGLRVIVM